MTDLSDNERALLEVLAKANAPMTSYDVCIAVNPHVGRDGRSPQHRAWLERLATLFEVESDLHRGADRLIRIAVKGAPYRVAITATGREALDGAKKGQA